MAHRQVHRWFEGEPYLNGFTDIFKRRMIKVVRSLPACYAWDFLDGYTWGVNKAALAGDPKYPLPTYPSTDATTGVDADPYDPQTNGALAGVLGVWGAVMARKTQKPAV